MAAVPPQERDVDIDIGHLARAVWRRKRVVLLCTAAFAGVAFAIAGFLSPVYKSDAQIVVEDRESSYTRPATGAASSDSLNAESVESQVSLITSDEILGAVAERFALANRDEYAPNRSLLDRVITRIQPAVRVTSGEVIEKMHGKLNVFRKENTRVLVVEFSSHDPALARDVPNAIAAEYLARQKGALLSSNTSATGWLEEEIADLRKAVKAAEERVADFRASSDLLVGQNQSVLANQQLSEMSSELSRTRAARAASEGRAQSIREALERGLPLDSIAEVLGAPTVQALRERQVALRSEIADLSTTLLDNHPRLRSLRSQLRDIDAEVTREAKKVQSSLETQADSARQRETALSSEMDRLKGEAARAGTEEVELRSLEREALSQSELLESYLTRYREAVARGARDYLPVDARVFSEARMPAEPYFPKILPITAAAGIAGFLVAVLGLLVTEIFSGRALQPAPSVVRREAIAAAREDDGRRDDLPSPLARSEVVAMPVKAVLPQTIPPADLAEAVIASGIARVVVTGRGEGGALALARALSARSASVVLLDLAGGAVLAAMGLDASAPGLSDVGTPDLAGHEIGFADIIHRDAQSPVNAIGRGARASVPSRADLLSAYAALAGAYDCTVVACDALTPLDAILDEEAALVIAHAPGDLASAAERLAELKAAGHADVLLMTAPDDADAAIRAA